MSGLKKSGFAALLFLISSVLTLFPAVQAGEDGSTTPVQGKNLRLAADGATDYRIVLPAAPTPVQTTAASELANYLKESTGAEFPIISETEIDANAEKLLIVGPSALSKKFLGDAEEKIGCDGILLETNGSRLIFSGHPERGPLYAVDTFLEEALGVRWWTSDAQFVPKHPTLDVAPIHRNYAPKLISRESFYRDPHDGERGGVFSARMKCNGHFNRIAPEYGGHLPILYWAHSFAQILPPQKYFAEHPEWYPLIGGERKDGYLQLCLTNEEMFREFVRVLLKQLRQNPKTKFVSVSQNDGQGWCECPACQKLVDENGSQAGPLLDFVNRVAAEVEKEFPDVLVETLAYNQSRFAPSKIRPRDNVVVRLCTIECSFVTPLAEGGRNATFKENIDKWSAISKNLYIWDYVTNFLNYMCLNPNYAALAPNIRYFVDHHAVGIFEQGDAECSAGDFVRLRNWVISKLLWDPSLDQRALENEFLAGYYSPSVAPILREYLDLITSAGQKADIFIGCYMANTEKWLDTPTLIRATELMNRAEETARTDEAADPVRFAGLTKKLERESLPVRLAWISELAKRRVDLVTQKLAAPLPDDMTRYYSDFTRIIVESGAGSNREGGHGAFADWLETLSVRFGPAAEPPEVCRTLPAGSWCDAQEFDFRLAGLNRWVFLDKDAAASNGYAARMPGDHIQWAAALYASLAPSLASPSGKSPDENGRVNCRVLLFARCDKRENAAGSALTLGIHDEENKKGIFGKTLSVEELAGPEYKQFDLGVFPLDAKTLLWTAPVNRPDAVPNVYIDRIVLIRE